MTPRKFFALLTVHYDVLKSRSNDSISNTTNGFIDNIPGW